MDGKNEIPKFSIVSFN